MSVKNLAIIQARIGSTRLPGKVMLKIYKKTILEHVINRVKKSRLIDLIVVATTLSVKDMKIVKLCSSKNILVYCGESDDVLDRFYQVAKIIKPKNIIRITSDCPLIDSKIIDNVISAHLKSKADYTANTFLERFPDGEDVEVFKYSALQKAWEKAKLESEREHVTPFLRKHPEIFKHKSVVSKDDYHNKRWTLDEKKDFVFIKNIYKFLYLKNNFFGMKEILNLLKLHPELENINSKIIRNEGYGKSFRKDKIKN